FVFADPALFFLLYCPVHHRVLPSFPTRRSSDLSISLDLELILLPGHYTLDLGLHHAAGSWTMDFVEHIADFEVLNISESGDVLRSEEHTSELQSRRELVCRLLLEKKNKILTSSH